VKILYLAADAVPAPKGAAVRIRTTVRLMRELGHDVELFTPAGAAEGDHDTVELEGDGFLERMMALRRAAEDWLRGRRADLVQFRGIWEGVPAVAWARRSGAAAALEAHGFPSVELHYHFSGLATEDRVLRKIIAEEQAVLGAVDRVVTPSATGARFLEMRGVKPDRIDIIPNAVDAELFSPGPVPPPDGAPLRLVYAGTLSPWQGLPTLLEAMERLRGGAGVELHVVGPAKSSWREGVRALARRLRVHHALHLSGSMDQADLVPVLRTAHACVAPLPGDPRNSVQGCCPIKILEYMAAARPILSTEIAPVLEILSHGKTAWLVEPGSPAALAEGIAWMRAHPTEREAMGARAREEARARWTPALFRDRLRLALDRLAKRVI
jgi:glycosyltransferase involved in cell wall biosynthesis